MKQQRALFGNMKEARRVAAFVNDRRKAFEAAYKPIQPFSSDLWEVSAPIPMAEFVKLLKECDSKHYRAYNF